MLKVCKDLFDKWNDSVRYCHWKSNEHLEEGLDGKTDLDVFVHPEDKTKAEELLRDTQYIKFLPQKGCRYPLVDEWIGFDYSTGKLVHVHLHYQIITGTKFVKEYIFPLDEEIISSRILDKENKVYIIHPELEAIILFCRIVLKSNNKKHIVPSEDAQVEIDFIKKQVRMESLYNLCVKLLGDEKGARVCDMILMEHPSCADWYRLYRIIETWLKPFRKYSKLLTKVIHLKNYLRLGLMTILNKKCNCCYITRKTQYVRGLSICFIGADGSGKSTVTKELTNWLNWKISAKRFYLGSGDGYNSMYNNFLNKLRKKNSNNKKVASDTKPFNNYYKRTTIKAQIGMILIGKEAVRIASRALKQSKKATEYAAKGAISLMDRFPQIEYPGVYDGPKIEDLAQRKGGTSFISKILSRKEKDLLNQTQVYQPNIVFKLLLPAEESMRRKPFENRASVEQKARITPLLNFENSKVYDIDATQDYNTEILIIKRIIWESMLENQ